MKKGISLVTLMVTIVVIITFTSTIVITGTNINNNVKRVKFASELSYIEEMISSYKSINFEYPVLDTQILNIDSINSDIIISQFNGEQIIDDNISLYQIDYSKLGNFEFEIADKTYNNDNVYLLSINTGKVYYKKGYKIDGKTYYTLTDDLKESINYTQKNNVNDGIIFTNNIVDKDSKTKIKIRIPSRYVDVKISSTDKNFSIESLEDDSNYKVYDTVLTSNSIITINYKTEEGEEEKTLKYNVDNVDNVAPSFSVSNVFTMKKKDDGSKEERYIKIENLYDNFGQIEFIKYENKEISLNDAKEYFKRYGEKVKDNIIFIEENVEYISVYAQDKAGNFTLKTVSVKK